jgi:site-specific recombinase XerD
VSDLPSRLDDWWDDYARSCRRRNFSERTVALYRRAWLRYWRWALVHGVDPDPAAVTADAVNGWVDQLRAEVKPQTVAIYWRTLRPFFSWWAKEVEAANPFDRADTPGEPRENPDVIPLDDIRALLATCKGRTFDNLRDNAVVRVLYDTGVRRGELIGLRLGDWDRKRDLLQVTGKTGARAVPLSPSTGEALARYVRARADHPAAARSDALWLGAKGELRDSGVAQLLARRCAQAGLPRLKPHQFRHTFAHEYRHAGGDPVDLMYLAGWKSLAMTERYGRSAAAQRARAAHRRLGLGDRL